VITFNRLIRLEGNRIIVYLRASAITRFIPRRASAIGSQRLYGSDYKERPSRSSDLETRAFHPEPLLERHPTFSLSLSLSRSLSLSFSLSLILSLSHLIFCKAHAYGQSRAVSAPRRARISKFRRIERDRTRSDEIDRRASAHGRIIATIAGEINKATRKQRATESCGTESVRLTVRAFLCSSLSSSDFSSLSLPIFRAFASPRFASDYPLRACMHAPMYAYTRTRIKRARTRVRFVPLRFLVATSSYTVYNN